ncbi:acetylxylan esterase [Planctomycetaceae bacterium SH139]
MVKHKWHARPDRHPSLNRRLLTAALASSMAMAATFSHNSMFTAANAQSPLGENDGGTDAEAKTLQLPGWQADGKLVADLQARSNHPFNYDEAAVPEYELPDVLGAASEDFTAAQWPARREALLEQFRGHVYGRRPAANPEVFFQYEAAAFDPTGGKAIGKRLLCRIRLGEREFAFPFLIYTPRQSQQSASPEPMPLVVLINNREFPDPQTMGPEASGFWPIGLLIDAGFATAVFHTSDVDPDRADGYEEGIRGFFAENAPRGDESWGSLSAWGWAASRVLDFALKYENIDPQQTAVVGHSRGGKTALWAAAEDPRFKIAYANESGCGGAALSRRRYGETIARITSAFPHWFCPKLTSYSDQEDRLPVDQHQLIALLAPRSVYVASAAEDLWADPRGEYLSIVKAAPAFQLLGKASITDPSMPPLDQPRHVGATGYHIRPGKHNLTRHDWQYFLQFAKSQFAK